MRSALALAAALLGGCFLPTWRSLPPGGKPDRGAVAIVGRVAVVPPIALDAAPAPGVVLRPEETRSIVALFTADLDEPFDDRGDRMPLQRTWSARIPLDTWFFVEVPTPETLYLRGLVAASGAVAVILETPARLPIAPGDRVAYVGDLTVVRARPPRLSCRSRLEDARRAAEVFGHGALLGEPWAVRLAEPASAETRPGAR